MGYYQGLLIGRAFALANGNLPARDARDSVGELCQLANGDRQAIVQARARYRQFLLGPSSTVEDERALRLLDAALSHFDQQEPV